MQGDDYYEYTSFVDYGQPPVQEESFVVDNGKV